MFLRNGTGGQADWIQSSQDNVNWEGYVQKSLVTKISPVFIANTNTVRANRQDRPHFCQVAIFTADRLVQYFDTQDISGQTTWFNSAWTTAAQFQGGLNQAVSDLQSWVG